MSQLLLQPGPVNGIDTWMDGEDTGVNYGTNDILRIGAGYEYHASGAQHALLRFDASALIGSVIESAILTLYCKSVLADGHVYQDYQNPPYDYYHTITCYRCPKPWTELGATWDEYDGTNAWSVPDGGGDYDSSIAAVCEDIYGLVNLTFDIKAHVEDAITNRAGELSLICVITGNDGGFGIPEWRHDYYSSDEPTENTKRPKLVIDYIKTSQGIKPSQFLRGNPVRTSNLRALTQV